ncbi:NmrA/HSCARG family protein [Aspergillus mulundensis]|uniref:NmrA-like domain-containing protein n=1 Tax=Aspergillus mulundensis TaxID=1810919 RepID=A0A3D8SDD1_9EURO|nr:Uncharacterized protein DSM5745_04430 [Aspergillus mulundensis]RDW84104.1 Uncharacterized protein DSM5745_04430 [Aspergillus mulundensis]
MTTKLVTVVGATGQQGQAVVAAFTNNPAYRVRGLTRNPDSAAAKALASQGVEVVKADLNDFDTVAAAFADSHIIYAVTDFWALYQKDGFEKARDTERQEGYNMVRAAAAVPTLEHYIWSTLAKPKEEYPVYHFDGKFAVDELIRKEYPDLHAKTTLILVCFYGNNLQIASMRPYWIETAQKYVQFTTYDPQLIIPFIGDVKNLTPFIEAIVSSPAEKVKNGALVIASIAQWTAEKWVVEWARARGKEAQLVRISREDYDKLWPWPRWAEEFALMMDYFQFVPPHDWIEPGVKVLTAQDLDVQPVQTMEEWVESYELPDPNSVTF